MNILVVDDSSYIREQFQSFLNGIENVSLYEAGNAQDAIKCFNEKDIDLLVVDSVMPEKSGVEVIKEVLKIKPKTIIVGLTTQVNGSTRNKLIEAGVAKILKKPFTKNHLLEILEDYI